MAIRATPVIVKILSESVADMLLRAENLIRWVKFDLAVKGCNSFDANPINGAAVVYRRYKSGLLPEVPNQRY